MIFEDHFFIASGLFLVAIDGALVQVDDIVDERLGFEHLNPFCTLQELALEVGGGFQSQFEVAVIIGGLSRSWGRFF